MSDTIRAPDTIDTPYGALPRDPEQYRPSDHFVYRFNRRTDPEITGDVIHKTITEGNIVLEQTAGADGVYAFEADVNGTRWRVFVGYNEPAATWRVVTAYAPECHSRDWEAER